MEIYSKDVEKVKSSQPGWTYLTESLPLLVELLDYYASGNGSITKKSQQQPQNDFDFNNMTVTMLRTRLEDLNLDYLDGTKTMLNLDYLDGTKAMLIERLTKYYHEKQSKR